MSQPELLQGPVRAPPSAEMGGETSGIGPMKRKMVRGALNQLNRNSNHGDSFPGIEVEAVHVVEQALVFPRHAVSSPINDNYSGFPTKLNLSHQRLGLIVKDTQEQTLRFQNYKQDVSCIDVNHVPTVTFQGQPQNKSLSPGCGLSKIKFVKGVSCVSQCLSAPSVPNVPHVATEISVGGRLQSFWQVWQRLGSNPRVVSVLRDGYNLPFRERPHLSRFPLIVSKYASPTKNKALLEALSSLIQKQAVEKVVVKSSLVFYNRLFLVPKPNRKWRPILDLSKLNLFITTNTFKMETPETIRLSLQTGEWVTSLDFSDAYFHIPIAQRSRKYLRFHLNKVTYQFKSLPFGLATAPLEFTKVVKEVKLMAQAMGIRIHQYLDDWLLRAPCQATCLQHTRTLLALCHELIWVVNMKKSELTPQQVFNFIDYRFDLLTGLVLPTQDQWSVLKQKLKFIRD